MAFLAFHWRSFCLSSVPRFCLVFVSFLLRFFSCCLAPMYCSKGCTEAKWAKYLQVSKSKLSDLNSSLSVAKEMLLSACSRYELLNVIHKLLLITVSSSFFCVFFGDFLWFVLTLLCMFSPKKCQHLEGSASGARIRRIGKGLDSAVHTGKNDAISPDSRAAWMSFKFHFISWNLLPRAARAIRLYKQPKAEPNLWPAFCPTELSKLKTLCFKLL